MRRLDTFHNRGKEESLVTTVLTCLLGEWTSTARRSSLEQLRVNVWRRREDNSENLSPVVYLFNDRIQTYEQLPSLSFN